MSKRKETINRQDLTNAVCNEIGLTKTESSLLVARMFSIITEELERNKSVKLTNFGSFDVLHKAARMGRNPKTGQAFVIKARRVISFRASKYLIDRVNCAKR